jgi:hypothetical protein
MTTAQPPERDEPVEPSEPFDQDAATERAEAVNEQGETVDDTGQPLDDNAEPEGAVDEGNDAMGPSEG